MYAAVVEFDPLTDPVRTAAEDHDLFPVGRFGLALLLVGGVEIGGVGHELGGTGIDPLVNRLHVVERNAVAGHHLRWCSRACREHLVGKADTAWPHAGCLARNLAAGSSFLLQLVFLLDDLADIVQEPGVDGRMPVDLLDRHAAAQGIAQVPEPVAVGHAQFFQQQLLFLCGQCPAGLGAKVEQLGIETAGRRSPVNAAPSGTTP